MPRKPKYRKPYPPEFRREAVALYTRTDRTLGEIAGDLGVAGAAAAVGAAGADRALGARQPDRRRARGGSRAAPTGAAAGAGAGDPETGAAFFVRESETR
jgi:transposase-like protein